MLIIDDLLIPEWVGNIEESDNFVFITTADLSMMLPDAVHLEWMLSVGLQYCGTAWASSGIESFCCKKV